MTGRTFWSSAQHRKTTGLGQSNSWSSFGILVPRCRLAREETFQ